MAVTAIDVGNAPRDRAKINVTPNSTITAQVDPNSPAVNVWGSGEGGGITSTIAPGASAVLTPVGTSRGVVVLGSTGTRSRVTLTGMQDGSEAGPYGSFS